MEKEHALRKAIAALQEQTSELGDAAVAAAIAPLQAQLDRLGHDGWRAQPQRLRLVTVLFCDIVGSTTMARELDPEDVHAVVDSALATLSGVIDRHGGRVLQYAGDSILAVFGAEASREEDPRHAVRAGLEMLQTANGIAREATSRHNVSGFDIRVGIHTGRVLLGAGVDRHNSIRGMPVNVAARMEQSAPAGGLRISHATYRLVRGAFDVLAQPPIDVKGLDQPMRSYLVRRERDDAVRTASRGVDGIEVRLVGREAELAHLKNALDELVKSDGPTAQLVLIAGEAGIGKSRLADEFELYAATREAASIVLQGRALAQTRHQPYGLLRDLFFSWLRIRGSDSGEQARATFQEAMAALFGAPADDDLLLLAHVMGLHAGKQLAQSLGDPRVVRQRAFRAATRCILQCLSSTRQPLVLMLDDLHWADDDSLAWLQQLLRSASPARLLVLGMTRPRLLQQRADWPGEAVPHSVLALEPLSDEACASLASELLQRLDTVPDRLGRRLAAAAEGNPFYLEERVKILLDDGAIVSDGQSWRLVPQRLSLERLPHTLTGLLQARLDRLGKAERRALRQAAIVGFVFWDEALAAIDPASSALLDALERRELIVSRSDSTLEGAREYVFHHHTLHQVARDGVLKADRVRYHRCVGEWLQVRTAQRPGEFHGRIALHFERAQEAPRALHHYVLGAEAAVARYSRDAVLRYVRRALRLAPEASELERWRLHAAREAMLATSQERETHSQDLAAMADIAEHLADDGKRAVATWRRSVARCSAGDYPQALTAAEAAEALATTADDAATAAAATAIQAIALRRLNKFDQAQRTARRGLLKARDSGSLLAEKELLYSLAALAAESGRLEESTRLGTAYLELARSSGDQSAEAIGLNLVGDSAYRLGELERARGLLEQSLALAESIGYPYCECIAALNLAMVANGLGRFDEAVLVGQKAVDIAIDSGSADLEAVALLQLGLAQDGCGDLAGARQTLLAAGDRYDANGSAHLRVETDSALARVALRAGDRQEAAARLERVVRYLDDGGSLDGTEDPVRIHWSCFDVLTALGDARADAWLEKSRALVRQRAAQIDDAAKRTAYLTSTRHHAALAAAWKLRGQFT